MDPVVSPQLAPIDPGEKWAAVLGIKPVLSKRVENITDGQHAEVAGLEEKIGKRARALVRDSLVTAPFVLCNYEKILDQTSEAIDIPQIEAMIREIPSDQALAYMTVAQNCYNALQAALPRSAWTTFAGNQNLTPDFADLLKFSDLFSCLEDPVTFIFGAIADGSLDRDLAAHVKELLPTLTAAITSAITDAVVERVTKDRAFTLPWKAEIGMEAWLGTPVEAGVPGPEAQAPGGGSGGSKSKKSKGELADSSLSPADKIEAA